MCVFVAVALAQVSSPHVSDARWPSPRQPALRLGLAVAGDSRRSSTSEPLLAPQREGLGSICASAAYWLTSTSGTIHATEFQSQAGGGETLVGTELRLEDDFDIDRGGAQLFSISLEMSDARLVARYLYEISSWSNMLARDIRFNETFYEAGTEMHSEIHHYRFEAFYEDEVYSAGDPGWIQLSLRAGYSLDRLDLKLRGNGRKKGEDFGDQIIPLIGLSIGMRPTSWLDIAISLDHGLDLIEFDRFSEDTRWTDIVAQARIAVSPSASLILGYRLAWVHTVFRGVENDKTANSADNEFDLFQRGPVIALELRF